MNGLQRKWMCSYTWYFDWANESRNRRRRSPVQREETSSNVSWYTPKWSYSRRGRKTVHDNGESENGREENSQNDGQLILRWNWGKESPYKRVRIPFFPMNGLHSQRIVQSIWAKRGGSSWWWERVWTKSVAVMNQVCVVKLWKIEGEACEFEEIAERNRVWRGVEFQKWIWRND